MVDRDTVIEAINKFIKDKELKQVIMLFEYLCELKGETDKAKIREVTSNPLLLWMLVERTLEELQRELSINNLIDKNKQLILVF